MADISRDQRTSLIKQKRDTVGRRDTEIYSVYCILSRWNIMDSHSKCTTAGQVDAGAISECQRGSIIRYGKKQQVRDDARAQHPLSHTVNVRKT